VANPLDPGEEERAASATLEARKSQVWQEANPLGLSGTEVVKRIEAAVQQLGKKQPDAAVQLQHNCEPGSVTVAVIKYVSDGVELYLSPTDPKAEGETTTGNAGAKI
jgi:hypothetical protein